MSNDIRTFNLLTHGWLPVRRKDGSRDWVRPLDIADIAADSNPVMRLDTGRAEFDAAAAYFLIGLLQTVVAPIDSTEWEDWFSAPDAKKLEAELAEITDAFWLDGNGPRFMQEFGFDLRTAVIKDKPEDKADEGDDVSGDADIDDSKTTAKGEGGTPTWTRFAVGKLVPDGSSGANEYFNPLQSQKELVGWQAALVHIAV